MEKVQNEKRGKMMINTDKLFDRNDDAFNEIDSFLDVVDKRL